MIDEPSSLSVRGFLRRSTLFAHLSREDLAACASAFDMTSVAADEILLHKGAPPEALFVLALGRLESYDPDAPPAQRLRLPIRPGQPAGDIAVMMDQPHSATVQALRDSVVLRLTRERFLALVGEHPQILFALNRILIERFFAAVDSRPAVLSNLIVALAPITRSAPTAEFARKLLAEVRTYGSVLHLRADAVERFRLEAADLETRSGNGPAFLRWLYGQEEAHAAIVLEVEPDDTAWSRFCLREADTVLLVASGRDASGDTAVSERLRHPGRVEASDRRELVLIHPDHTRMPSGTRRWLDAFPVSAHHHVRLGTAGDVRRVARFLMGRAVLLALSGGAARGFAHAGVIRALEEARVPVDLVCGTSMGALFGGLYALGMSSAQIHEAMRAAFVERTIYDPIVPLVSAIEGKRLERFLEEHCGSTQIEDLWRRYFAMASNLSTSEPVQIRSGSLAQAIRLSSSVPGIFPPVAKDGQLYIDGLFLDNLPAERAMQEALGKTIAVNVVRGAEPRLLDALLQAKGPLGQFARAFRPFDGQYFPPVMELVLQAMFLSTVHATEGIRRKVNLYIEPDVSRFNLLQGSTFDAVSEAGYGEARVRLRQWMERDAEVARL